MSFGQDITELLSSQQHSGWKKISPILIAMCVQGGVAPPGSRELECREIVSLGP